MHAPFTVNSLLSLTLILSNFFSTFLAKVDYDKDKTKCDHCNTLVNKFKEGLKRTQKGNFGGGNTAWEEKALGPWKTSETRLLEILGEGDYGVCKKDFGCATLLENEEETIEEWFYKNQDKDMFQYLCVEQLKYCCSDKQHFGKKCKPCPGIVDGKPCNGHGKCLGGGDKSGKGTCSCDSGHTGKQCENCKKSHYKSEEGNCEKCDRACKECFGPGNEKCSTEECAKGYEAVEVTEQNTICRDIDECAKSDTCKENQVCTNTPGSFRCNSCHKACKGCTAVGAKRCIECAEGYHRKSNDNKECVKDEEKVPENDAHETNDDEAPGGGQSPGHDEL